jgi:hypothetical protein
LLASASCMSGSRWDLCTSWKCRAPGCLNIDFGAISRCLERVSVKLHAAHGHSVTSKFPRFDYVLNRTHSLKNRKQLHIEEQKYSDADVCYIQMRIDSVTTCGVCGQENVRCTIESKLKGGENRGVIIIRTEVTTI